MIDSIITLIFSMFLTIALIPVFNGIALRLGAAIDVPNERKVHCQPIPKIGGMAMAFGVIAPMMYFGEPLTDFIKAVLLGSSVLVFFGLLDDIRDLHFTIKFAGQFLAASIVIFIGDLQITDLGGLFASTATLSPYVSLPLTAIIIVGITNAINLADGLDGLAGGICMLSYIVISYFAYSLGYPGIFLLSFAVIGAIFGFLRFNTYPASIFMGDTGSQLLGFIAVTLSLKITQDHTPVSPYIILLILGFPVLDTALVVFERVSSGKSPFIADKNHLHHKLMRLGFFHTESVLVIYVIQSLFVISSYYFRYYTDLFVVIYYLFLSLCIFGFIWIADKRNYTIKRYYFIDKIIKGRFREFKESNMMIEFSFRFILITIPSLYLATCIIPLHIPNLLSIISIFYAICLTFIFYFRKDLLSAINRVIVFTIVPFVVYFSIVAPTDRLSPFFLNFFELMAMVSVFFIVLTVKLSRRNEGLKPNPLHFLIIFVALIIPNLPGDIIGPDYLGVIAAKIIFFFFGFEVLFGELRNKAGIMTLVTLFSLIILASKALF